MTSSKAKPVVVYASQGIDVPAWVSQVIGRGVQRLLALSLDGSPPRDIALVTIRVWCRAVCLHKQWLHDRDLPRFIAAFDVLSATRTRWPAPADFLAAMPSPLPDPLPEPRLAIEDAAARERVAAMLREVGRQLGANPARAK